MVGQAVSHTQMTKTACKENEKVKPLKTGKIKSVKIVRRKVVAVLDENKLMQFNLHLNQKK